MFFCYLALLKINYDKYKLKISYLNITLILFVFSFAVSTFVGVDPYHSFWDNHERMLGLFTVLHYVAYYFICLSVFKDWKDWKWAGRVFLFAGFIVMFVGWLQTQNPDLLLNSGSDRVASTLGNPIYVGGYGLFLTFLAILLFSREKNTLWKLFYSVAGFFGFMGMFWSGTRGSLLGLLFGFGFALVGYVLVLKDKPKIRYSLLGVSVLVIIFISVLYIFRSSDFVKKLPAIGRAVNTTFSDIETSPRWIAWNIAIESWKEKPIFGWGPNNYFYAFNKYYNSRSLDFGYGETWFDNSHNIILNTLSVQGAFGLLIYFGLYIVAIFSLIKAYRNKVIDYHFMLIGGGFLVAHFVGTITVFEDPTSYLYLMFWLALISSLINQNQRKDLPALSISDKNIGNSMILSLVFLSFVLIFIFDLQPAKANQKALSAIRALMSDPISGLVVAKDAVSFNSPHVDDIRSDISRSTAQILAGGWQKLGKDKANELLLFTTDNLEKNLILHPLDIRNSLTLGQMYQLGALINNNASYLLKTEGVLTDALAKSPKRQQIIYSLAGVKIQLGKNKEAISLLEQALRDDHKVGETYWRLAYSYQFDHQDDKSRDIIKQALDNGAYFNDQEKELIKKFLPATNTANIIKRK